MRKITLQPISCLVFALSTMLITGQETSEQNLVVNPGFEYFKNCPKDYGTLSKDVENIFAPTQGSTDYFNSCSMKMTAASNFMGYQKPFEGEAYIGMYMYAPKDYREYVTLQLQDSLKQGQTYEISFFVSLAEKAEYAVSKFGILFTGKEMEIQTRRNIPVHLLKKRGLNTYTTAGNPHYFTDKDGWTQVKGEYMARGDEKFITIGNFESNIETPYVKKGKNLKKAAYYFIDHISVKESGSAVRLDELYVLGDLKYDLNGYTVTNKRHPQLDQLVKLMQRDKKLVVSLYGHTDDVGSDKYNKALSSRRAKAVAAYLASKGISEQRIRWRGYGEFRPMAENTTEEGRLQNRRVEFIVSKRYTDHANLEFEDK